MAYNLPSGVRVRDLEGDDWHFAIAPVEEDGCEIFTPMPDKCLKWPCDGIVENREGFMRCAKCGASYGEAQ